MNDTLSWEERYKKLEQHHQEETQVLIAEITRLEKIVHDYCFDHIDDSFEDFDYGWEPLTTDDDVKVDPK